MTRWSRTVLLFLLSTALFAGDTSPVVVPEGPEFFLTGGDTSGGARVAMDDEGNFMGLHFDFFSGFVDARGGTPGGLEPPFGFGGGSRGAALAAMGGGEFVISWSQDQYPPDFFEHVFLRRYQVDGTPVGPAVPVSDVPTEMIAARTAVAARPDSFLVAWEDWTGSPTDSDIRGRIIPLVGPPAPSFLLSSWTTGQQTDPRLAAQPDGSALVVWRSSDCTPADPSNGCIRARHIGPSGTPSGPDFALNSETSGLQTQPAVTTAGDGFVAAWLSTDCGSNCVRGRRLDAGGTPLGGDFRVDEAGSGGDGPGVGGRSGGSFVVAWRRFMGGDFLTYARAFDAAADPLTGEFQVNTTTSSTAYDPDVAMNAVGDFVVIWSNNYELWGRRFDLREPVFEDGFESGDTSRWSATIP